MLDIDVSESGKVVLNGRFDASQVAAAESAFATIEKSVVVDCEGLEYISSAGLGVLIAVYKRLKDSGDDFKLINVRGHIKNVFHYACLDKVFDIQ